MSGIMSSVTGTLGSMGSSIMAAINQIFPPEKRAEALSKLKQFAVANPKLAAFLTTQIALTGFPLVLFIAFSITVFIFALIVALLIGLLAAVAFTLFMVGVALLVVLPTIFLTTFAATFLFLWGLGGFYLLKWFNDGDAPAPEGLSIGDKLNSWTGGKMGWLVEGTRKTQEDIASGVDQTPKTHGDDDDSASDSKSNGKSTNGHSGGDRPAPKKLEQASKPAEGVKNQTDGTQKRVTKGTSNATNAASATKGATSGATG